MTDPTPTPSENHRPAASQSPQPPQSPQPEANTVGLLGLTSAIVGTILSLFPIANLIGWLLLLVGLVLGNIAVRRKGQEKGLGTAAIMVSVLGGIIAVIAVVIMVPIMLGHGI